MSAVVHYMCPSNCPECDAEYDPVSGYCAECEGAMVLYRVAAFTKEWLAHTEGPPPHAPARTVSTRRVTETVAAFLAYKPALITIQKVEG